MTVIDRLRSIADSLPDGAMVTLPVAQLRAWLNDEPASAPPQLSLVAEPQTWREKLWACPDETRLGIHELMEATGRSQDWCYRAASSKHAAARGREPLPCRRMDGCLTFRAADVRAWLQRFELRGAA